MSFRTFFRGVLWMIAMAGMPALAQASCGSASCPVDTASGERHDRGIILLGYQFEYLDQDQPRLGTRKAGVGAVRGHHDEVVTINRIHRLLASVGVTDRLSVDLQMPYMVRSHTHIDHDGGDTREAWDLHGLGDLAVLTRYAFFRPVSPRRPTLSALIGGEFPTGRHHLKNADGNEAEPGVQPGSNSYDLILGVSSRQEFAMPMLSGRYGTLPVFTSVVGQLNGPGNDDYRLGDTLRATVGTSYPLLPRWGAMLQLNFLWRDRDGQGRTSEEIQKTGGEFLYVSPGLEFRPARNWTAYAMIQVPVYQRVNSIQLTSDYNVMLGVTYRFTAWGRRSPS